MECAVAGSYYQTNTFKARRSVGYLIRRLNNLTMPHAEARFADQELTFTHWIALMSLRDGISSTSSDIARHLGHDTGATTRMVDQLEARGLVARCRDGVILASSDLDRRGQRQDGPLWRALGPLVRARARAEE